MWKLPDLSGLEPTDETTVRPNAARYLETKDAYVTFANAVLERLNYAEEAL